MALFLEDAELPVKNITIEEAYEGLLEATNELVELNETLLVEDFNLHVELTECILNEEEKLNKESSFLVKTATLLKATMIKVKEKIVAFFQKVGSIFLKIFDKIKNKTGDTQVPTGGLEAAENASNMFEKAREAVLSISPTDTKAKIKEKTGQIFTKTKEALLAARTKLSQTSTSPAKMEKITAIAEKGTKIFALAGLATFAYKKATDRITLERLMVDSNGKSVLVPEERNKLKFEMERLIENNDGINKAWTMLASLSGQLQNTILKLFKRK